MGIPLGFIITLIIEFLNRNTEEQIRYREASAIICRTRDVLTNNSGSLEFGKDVQDVAKGVHHPIMKVGTYVTGNVIEYAAKSYIENKVARMHPDAYRIVEEHKNDVHLGQFIMSASFISIMIWCVHAIWINI
jgi:hypothetical protein